MKTLAEQKLQECLLKLLNLNQFKFFGYTAYNFDFKIQPVTVNTDSLLLSSIINYNKHTNKFELIFYESFLNLASHKFILFNILHNVLHILNQHNLRIKNRDKHLFEIAADHVINVQLLHAIQKDELTEIAIPQTEIIIDSLVNKNLTVEEVYDYLLDRATQTTESIIQISSENSDQKEDSDKTEINGDTSGDSKNQDSESDNSESDEDEDSESNEDEDENDDEEEFETDSNSESNNQNPKEDDDLEEEKEEKDLNIKEDPSEKENYTNEFSTVELKRYKIKINNYKSCTITNIDNIKEVSTIQEVNQLNEIKSSANLFLNQESISRSLNNGSLLEYLKNITKVEVPWTKLLEKAILVNTNPNPDIRSWINPKKRFRAHNILLPGTGIDKTLETLVICIDTSGSVPNKLLEQFAGIVLNSLSKFKKVWLLKHDIKITQNIILNANDINKEEIIKNMDGRGGTSHKAVYDKIEEQYLKQELQLGLILFLTDFESDIEDIYMYYLWTKVIPVIHIIHHRSRGILKYVPKDLDNNPIFLQDLNNY